MSRFSRLLGVAKGAKAEHLERCERIIYPHAARGMHSGELLDSQLELLLKTLSSASGVGIRAITKAYRAVAKVNPERQKGVESVGMYSVVDGAISHEKDTRDGPLTVPLCNFSARITEQKERDNGVEQVLVLALSGTLASGQPLPNVEVSAAQFTGLSWVVEKWGSRAVVYAGQGAKDHLRTAIQLLSGNVPRRTTYTHIGWREIERQMVYLHAGGFIAAPDTQFEPNDIQIEPPEGFDAFVLPEPPTGKEQKRVLRASLETLDLTPDDVSVPLLGAVYRSLLGTIDFGVHLAGQTGAGKSEFAAILQSHFGAGLTSRNLPGSWSSTPNYLEGLAFAGKDALIVVDDFAPEGTSNDIARYHATAARLFRAQGNTSGRGRMNADGSLRLSKPPRGMILSTGEDIPKGHSIKARALILEVKPKALDWKRLTQAQELAREGVYAAATASFIAYLANDYRGRIATFREDHARFRSELQRDGHKRTVDAGAQLLATYWSFLTFASEVGALDQCEHEALWQRIKTAIEAALEPQTALQAQSDPVARFSELLIGLFVSGRAHVLDSNNGESPGEGWGWESFGVNTLNGTERQQRPKGTRVGWLDRDNGHLYLEPSATYAELQRFARDQGECISVSQRILWTRLFERNLIVSRETPRMTVKRSLIGAGRLRVLHLDASSFLTGATGAADKKAVLQDSTHRPISKSERSGLAQVGQQEGHAKK